MKYCIYCGTNIPSDSIFCSKCGKLQKEDSIPEQNSKLQEKEVEKVDSESTNTSERNSIEDYILIETSSRTTGFDSENNNNDYIEPVNSCKLSSSDKRKMIKTLKMAQSASVEFSSLNSRLEDAEKRLKSLEGKEIPQPSLDTWNTVSKIGMVGVGIFVVGFILVLAFAKPIFMAVTIIGFLLSILWAAAHIVKSNEIKQYEQERDRIETEREYLNTEINECKNKIARYDKDTEWKKIPTRYLSDRLVDQCTQLINSDQVSSIEEAMELASRKMEEVKDTEKKRDAIPELIKESENLRRLSGRKTIINNRFDEFKIDDPICFRMCTVAPGFENELNFAIDFSKKLANKLIKKNIEAHFSMDEAISGNVKHPLLRIHHADYGDIGIMFNKNIVFIVRLAFGRVAQSIIEQNRLNNVADFYAQRQSSSFNSGGFWGVIEGIGNGVAAGSSRKKADNISYDTTELYFEKEWEKAVVSCINTVFD